MLSPNAAIAGNMDRHDLCPSCPIRRLSLAGRALALKAICQVTLDGNDVFPTERKMAERFALGEAEAAAVNSCLHTCTAVLNQGTVAIEVPDR